MNLPPDPALQGFADLYRAQKGFRAPISSTCEDCGGDFLSKTSLEQHARDVHPKEPVFDDELREQFLEKIRLGGRLWKTARALGVSPQTVKRAMKIDPSFADAVEIAEEEFAEEVEEGLRRRALAEDPWAVSKWLEKRSKSRWNDDKTVKVEVTGTVTHNHELLAHENRILALQETVRERAKLNGKRLELPNPEIIDVEVIE